MYTTADHEHRFSGRMPDLEREPEHSNDVTLGTGALLGIFFAIVIVCALFFGFGYSVGHRGQKPATMAAQTPAVTSTPPLAAAPAASPEPPALASEDTPVGAPPSPATSGAPKPSAGAPLPQQAAVPAPEPTVAAAEPALRSARPAASEPVAAERAALPPAAAAQFFVQIAAVVHSSDAEALAAALRRDGYNAQVRTEPQDHFLHIQVGPFPNRDAARAMRSRLQADGYNPIVKP